jgi:hypothetical protein
MTIFAVVVTSTITFTQLFAKQPTPAAKSENINIEIAEATKAEETTKQPDPDVKSRATNDKGISIREACSGSGQVRKVTVNGVCYAQMCCGGQWLFWVKTVNGREVWCTCNLNETWTVNCDGKNLLISCR